MTQAMMEKLLHNEYDSLKGNINRMFVTEEEKELDTEFGYAMKRLESIYKGLKEKY